MNLRFTLLKLFFIFAVANVNAQCDWWAEAFHGSASANIRDVTSDAVGNIYVVGSFTGTFPLGDYTMTSAGDLDVFFAKLSSEGEVLWAKSAGGLYKDEGYAISLDSDGNIYIGGNFHESAEFDSETINADIDKVAFIGKYNNDGTLLWVKECYGQSVRSIATFEDKVYFLPDLYETVVAEFTAGGEFVDYTSVSNSWHWNNRFKIRVDSEGNFLVGGNFSGSIDFGNGIINSVGGDDVFLAKYNPSKDLIWVQTAGGSNNDNFNDFVINDQNQVYVVVSFHGSINFNGIILNSSSGSNQAMAKFDSDGTQIWVKLPGEGNLYGISQLLMDTDGNLLHFTGLINYSATTYEGIELLGKGSSIIARYDPSGDIIEAVAFNSDYSWSWSGFRASLSPDGIVMVSNFNWRFNIGNKNFNNPSNYNQFIVAKIENLTDVVFKEPEICVVKADEASGKNVIFWNTDGMANVNYFTVYRLGKTGDLETLGNVDFNAENYFIDQDSEPVEREYFYSLSLTDVCGVEYSGEYESFYKTIHLQMFRGPGNRWSLSWTDYFGYGYGYDDMYYRIYRGTSENNLVPYDSIFFSTTYTDINAPEGDVYYKVVAVMENAECGGYPSSNRISNTENILGNYLAEDQEFFKLYPNPAQTSITLEVPGGNAHYQIIDPVGRIIEHGSINYSQMINVETFNKGIYRIVLQSDNGVRESKNFVVN
ncbi:MAG: T9SS type A sorting domain-containing protein [Cytophagaceae bacterium]